MTYKVIRDVVADASAAMLRTTVKTSLKSNSLG
jgi:hypothetical protein